MQLIDGKKIAQELEAETKTKLVSFRNLHRGVVIKIAVVVLGDDSATNIFIRKKWQMAQRLGIGFKIYRYPANITTEKLRKEIALIGRMPAVKGIIVQLPLPERINVRSVLNAIPSNKDVDSLCEKNLGKLYNDSNIILPPVTAACACILASLKIDLRGKNVVVMGRGNLVGKPTAIWAINQGATVSILNSKTVDASHYLKEADIIVTGVGQPGLINKNNVKSGSIILDASYAHKDGKPCGDCDVLSLEKTDCQITPVPGGIGPITVSMIYVNLLKLLEKTK